MPCPSLVSQNRVLRFLYDNLWFPFWTVIIAPAAEGPYYIHSRSASRWSRLTSYLVSMYISDVTLAYYHWVLYAFVRFYTLHIQHTFLTCRHEISDVWAINLFHSGRQDHHEYQLQPLWAAQLVVIAHGVLAHYSGTLGAEIPWPLTLTLTATDLRWHLFGFVFALFFSMLLLGTDLFQIVRYFIFGLYPYPKYVD